MVPRSFCVREKRCVNRQSVPRSLSISLGIQKAVWWGILRTSQPRLFVQRAGQKSAPLRPSSHGHPSRWSGTWPRKPHRGFRPMGDRPGTGPLPGRSLSISLKIQKAVLQVYPAPFPAQAVCSGSEAATFDTASLFLRTRQRPPGRQRAGQKPALLRPHSYGQKNTPEWGCFFVYRLVKRPRLR